MGKLTIKPWQVMQAHDNGAETEFKRPDEVSFNINKRPSFNWVSLSYRIANLTADGMRLDELVEKFPETICIERSNNLDGGAISTLDLIDFLCKKPHIISEVKVKQEKKLRPWTMVEFEKHRDEWFIHIETSTMFRITVYDKDGITNSEGYFSYHNLSDIAKREDGLPCGELE